MHLPCNIQKRCIASRSIVKWNVRLAEHAYDLVFRTNSGHGIHDLAFLDDDERGNAHDAEGGFSLQNLSWQDLESLE